MTNQETPRQAAERLAAARYPFVNALIPKIELEQRKAYVSGYLAGRDVTVEQVEAAARAVCRAHQDMDGDYPWNVQFEDGKEEYREWGRAAFRAVGFRIEGEE